MRRLHNLGASRPRQDAGSNAPLVLYVEDETANWEVVSSMLSTRFALLHAQNDRAACELFAARANEIDAVLMDVQLRGSSLDGIQLTRLLRGTLPKDAMPPYANAVTPLGVPVIFVTAYAGLYPTSQLRDAGGDAVVAKPIDMRALGERIDELVRRA